MTNIKQKLKTGSILPLAMVMAFVGLGIVFSYYEWMNNKVGLKVRCPVFPNIMMIDYIEPSMNILELIIYTMRNC